MRIAMISAHFSPLAAPGVHVAALAAALGRAGHDVTVHTRKDGRGQPLEVDADGYRVVSVPAGPARRMPADELLPHMAQFTKLVTRRWRGDPPDVVHSLGWLSGVAAVFAARQVPVPVVHTNRGLGTAVRRLQPNEDAGSSELIRWERLAARFAARIVATSTSEVAELRAMGVDGRRTSVVPGGVDCERFHPEGPTDQKRMEYRVVSVGRLAPHEGHGDLVAALQHAGDTELVVVGGPAGRALGRDPEVTRLRALAARLGVGDRVRFAGPVPVERMPALLRSADVVASAPWGEPFDTPVLEAMACGVPVLATAVGSLVDVVVDGVTGVLVPARRPRVLTTALRTLLADPLRREFLGATARDRVEFRYTWDRIAEDTVRVYEAAADRATPVGDGRSRRVPHLEPTD
jgi:glycosyltransferase involved in cell wall biosynthesis